MWPTGACRMRLVLLMLAVILVEVHSKVIKKNQKEVASPSETKQPTKKPTRQSAIIAIEIVDPKDNSTKGGKGRKRTIESSLGYGYQNFFNVQQRPPRYEVYKYSQHDIPSHKGQGQGHGALSHHHQGGGGPDFEIQKSVRYDLGSTKTEYLPPKHQQSNVNLNQYYQPGTTLFSTLDQQGHVGGLSQHEPQHNGDAMVPVIILRVFTNQLNQPGALHTNIPQNHPYANINNIDLQSLLAGYVQNHYSNPEYQQGYDDYQDQNYQHQQPQQQYYQQSYDHGLQTQENYPDEAHTKVIFHKDSVKQSTKTKAVPKAPSLVQKSPTPQKFKITIPENTYSKVEIQEHTYPQEQPQNLYYYQNEQQYYEPQPQQQQQQHTQQQYQYPDAKQYVQISTYPQQDQAYYQYQDVPQGYQDYQQGQTYEQPRQQQAYEQPQQGYEHIAQQQYEEQHSPQPTHISSQGQEHSIQNVASAVGHDLQPKLYNYHAHGPVRNHKTRSSTKKRRVKIPLAPPKDEEAKGNE